MFQEEKITLWRGHVVKDGQRGCGLYQPAFVVPFAGRCAVNLFQIRTSGTSYGGDHPIF